MHEDEHEFMFSPLQQHREVEIIPEQPALFVAMGSPTLLIERSDAHDFLRDMGRRWVSDNDKVKIMSNPYPKTVHDFFGFAECLDEVEYAATCGSEFSAKVGEALDAKEIPWEFDGQRGYDFGCWSPLALLFPSADVPVVQVSLHASLEAEVHCRLGEALGTLRDTNFLLVCSGGITHNLMDIAYGEAAVPPYAASFDTWVQEVLRYEENRSELVTPEEAWAARNARLARWLDIDEGVYLAARNCHASPEYFLPLFVASASGGSSSMVHHSWSLGCLSMATFMFGDLPPMLDQIHETEAHKHAAAAEMVIVPKGEQPPRVHQEGLASHPPAKRQSSSASMSSMQGKTAGDMPDKIQRPRTSSSRGSSRPASRAMVRQAEEAAVETDERKFVAMIELTEKGRFAHKSREQPE